MRRAVSQIGRRGYARYTMSLLGKVRAYARVVGRARRPLELLRLLRRRPPILLGVGLFETALLAAGRVDSRLKALGSLKTSARVGCPF